MRLGCEGAEPAGPGGGGAGAARGGSGPWLPGPPGWALPALMHARGSWLAGGLRGRGVPAACRARRDQRRALQAPVGGAARLPGHRHQSVQGAGALRATGGGAEGFYTGRTGGRRRADPATPTANLASPPPKTRF